MQYTLESFHDVEKNISDVFDTVLSTAKCKKLDDITERALVNSQSTKNLLASVIGILVGVLDNAQSVLKSDWGASVRSDSEQEYSNCTAGRTDQEQK